MQTKPSWLPTAVIVLFFCAMIVVTFVIPSEHFPTQTKYLVDILLFTGFSLALGQAVSGVSLGLVINERNLVSLSRFQMALWTVLILGGYMVTVAARIEQHQPAPFDPLDVGIDQKLWILLGITTTSLVGSPLLLSNKKSVDPSTADVERASKLGDEPVYDILRNKQGTLYANSKPQDAKFTDMFQGDEVGNTNYFDLAKMQMFYFTVLGAICFVYQMDYFLTTTDFSKDVALPGLPTGYLALMGISNAGYLTGKTVNYSTPGGG